MPLNLDQPKRKQAISLTPLIDVVFILLLFFMLTSSFVPWRSVDTPLSVSSSKPATPDKDDIIILKLKQNDGRVWVQGRAHELSDSAWLAELIRDHKKGTFAIRAEKAVTLQSLMNLADRLKTNGAKTVSIANAFAHQETP